MHIEEDCVGRMALPDDVLYGVHAARAAVNFPFKQATHPQLIAALLTIKKAAALTNMRGGTLAATKGQAIVAACDELLTGAHAEAFIVPAIQGGAGTSTNMNVNEVVAHLATRNTGLAIHPNDDVNQGQSTNDVYPSAGKIAALRLLPGVLSAISDLQEALLAKAKAYRDVIKVGRTQLQDAVPTTYGKVFSAYAHMFDRDLRRLRFAADALREMALGGTAIGTGINASAYYQQHIVAELSVQSGLQLRQAADLSDGIQNTDALAEFSGAFKALAINLNKLSNDLRLLASGPQAGLGELQLPARQAGSSIMPNKINPVIPEAVNQVAFAVIGNDVAITMATQNGQLELNAFEPLAFAKLYEDEEELTTAMQILSAFCVRDIKVNAAVCRHAVEHSAVAATVLAPYIGYQATTQLIKTALAEHRSVRQLIVEKDLLPQETVDRLFSNAALLGQDIETNKLRATGR
jgi:aspartate ammonia-lyase